MVNTTYSKKDPFAITHYELGDSSGIEWSGLSFMYTNASFVACVSSQIWCPEKCAFCATGDKGFKRNLTKEELLMQFTKAYKILPNITDKKVKKFSIIMEGMGEPSFNLQNIFDALLQFYPDIEHEFENIKFSISTSGRLVKTWDLYDKFIESYKKLLPKLKFEMQFSLHNPFQKERLKLVPQIHKLYSLDEMLNGGEEQVWLYKMAEKLWQKLKVNYLLLNNPDGSNNYGKKYLAELLKLLDPEKTKIKLTQYAETYKWFSSPNMEVTNWFKASLEKMWFEVTVAPIFGQDVAGGCGMLDYNKED